MSMEMSQKEFANFLGLRRWQVSGIECGRRDLMWVEYVTLEKVTGCSITYGRGNTEA